MSFRRVVAGILIAVCGAAPDLARAQGSSTVAAPASFETRAQLEAEARAAEAQHRTAQAFLLKTRLAEGDFREGDRIFVSVEGRANLTDTMVVRAGKVLQFPLMADLSLAGVLRSELQEKVRQHVGEYVREPDVRVRPLVRIAALGHVMQQGFYYVSADVLLNDVIMRAGGPMADANLQNIVIRRSGEIIWDQEATRTALSDGLSLDRLHLRAGDEITVGGKRSVNWMTVLQGAVTVLSLAVALSRF